MPDFELPVIKESLKEFRRPPNRGIEGNFDLMCDMYESMSDEARKMAAKRKKKHPPVPVKFKLID